jgi:hypothetical protein
MRGRHPVGPEYADQVEGSEVARARFKAIVATMSGACRLQEACAELGICPQRFHQLRQVFTEFGMAALEPGVPGRRAQTLTPEQELIQAQQQQIAELQRELEAAKAREEIALVLSGRKAPESLEKKTLPPRRRGRPPGTRKNT